MADNYLSTAELDFDTLKSDFVKFLRNQNQFKDYDFEGSNLATVIDLLTYNTFINAFYLNQVGTESFLDTAQLKESIVSHSKELGYTPRSRTSSRATLNLSKTADTLAGEASTDGTVTINKFTSFTTNLGSNTVTFSTDRDITATNDGTGTFVANNVNIFEGTVVTEFFDVTSANTKLVISSANVDTDSVDVVVQNSTTDLTNTSFTKAENLFNLVPTSPVFFIEGFGQDKYEIQFGNDVTGKRLSVGNIVRVRYRETVGEEGNNAKTFISSDNTITPTLVTKSSLGAERESNDSIRFNAPRVFSTQDRAVTVEDYKALLKAEFPTIETLNVVGGENLDPPRFGKVVVIPKPFGATVASQSLKDSIVDYLVNKTSISTEVLTADPKFIILDINTTVRYNSTQTSRTLDEIKTNVTSNILEFGTTNLSEFDKDFRYSKLLTKIDSTDTSILSNNTKVRMAKEITPVTNTPFDFVLEFGNEVEKGSITSSLFTKTINGVNFESSLDDLNGTIRVVSSTRGAKEVLDFKAGTVDYSTGKILLNAFSLNGYFSRGKIAFGDRVQVYAQNVNPDVIVDQDQIIQIQSLNTSVSVVGQLTDD